VTEREPETSTAGATGADTSDGGRLTPRSPWLFLAGLIVVGAIAAALWRWGGPLVRFFRTQEEIRAWLAQFGLLAPLISISLNVAQVLLAPIPGQFVGLANGFLFGVFWGSLYSVVGVTLGSTLAMLIGRWLRRPFVERIVSQEGLRRWDRLMTQRGPAFIFAVFLLPLLPDDLVCFAIGLSPLSIPYAVILATIARLPGLVASSWIGANASAPSPLGWALLITGTLLLAGAVLHYRDRLETWILDVAKRLSDRSHGGPV
jgi:uncharacterized membrane protein YdjX (TVP38/TMEM64 family)